jgi:hypothetical protein
MLSRVYDSIRQTDLLLHQPTVQYVDRLYVDRGTDMGTSMMQSIKVSNIYFFVVSPEDLELNVRLTIVTLTRH